MTQDATLKNRNWLVSCSAIFLLIGGRAAADGLIQIVDGRLHHLRMDGPREWIEFPESAESDHLDLTFEARKNTRPWTLQVRQQDVKGAWKVLLNDRQLGQLRINENDMVVYFEVPEGVVLGGKNVLRIEQSARRGQRPDDISVGEVALIRQPLAQALSGGWVEVEIVDGDNQQPLPCRVTVVRSDGALQTPGAVSNEQLAIRPGIVYTSTGQARFGLPTGTYTIYAGRGFEYSLDSFQLKLPPGQTVRHKMSIRREVPTGGYVACDTHVHSLTHSGHGDATVQERMITLAGEGIELPIATDHNVHIDHEPFARQMNVRQYFTPVIGNEVTTRLGHFNVFPVRAGAPPPNYQLDDWESIFAEIYRTPNVKVVILNHARDLHGGTRPFGPSFQNTAVGANLNGWQLRANAMEVINSSATQTDVLQLFHDWMTQLNHGRIITPVGSSDSHDVGRHFVGQGRTYIRCDDRDPGNIDVDAAVDSFLKGRVAVSYGLLTEMTVDHRYRSGELAPLPNDEVHVALRVLGPHWTKMTRIMLYANGSIVREANIDEPSTDDADRDSGVKWTGKWILARPKHDVHLVAIAIGPGIDGAYWKTAKPYQPTSPHWEPHVIGCSGAVWLDADADGRPTPAADYARRLFLEAGGDLKALIRLLDGYDQAVAIQAAHLCQSAGTSLLSSAALTERKDATPQTQRGFQLFTNAWRASQLARTTR